LFPYIRAASIPYHQLLPGLLCVALGACTSIAPPAEENSSWTRQRLALQELDSWQLRGRVNVRYENESHTPRIQWAQESSEYHIQLWGTFGAGRTTVIGRPGYVTLEQDNEILTASSPEQLMLDNLGYDLPVSQLESWIKGLPVSGSEANLSFNELNQLTGIEQEGWTISFSDLRQYGDVNLPRRVDLQRAERDIQLRFVGLSWTLEGDDG